MTSTVCITCWRLRLTGGTLGASTFTLPTCRVLDLHPCRVPGARRMSDKFEDISEDGALEVKGTRAKDIGARRDYMQDVQDVQDVRQKEHGW